MEGELESNAKTQPWLKCKGNKLIMVRIFLHRIHPCEMFMQQKHTRKASHPLLQSNIIPIICVFMCVSKKLTLAIFLLSRQQKRDLWKRFSSNLPYVMMHSERESITHRKIFQYPKVQLCSFPSENLSYFSFLF